MIVGNDVSHYQSLGDINAAVAAGAKYVVVKASDGMDTDNPGGAPEHDAEVARARALGVTVGHYHFARHVGQAAAEADHFLALAKPQPGDLLALDLEAMDGGWVSRLAYALAWLRRVQAATGATPFWYVNKDWRQHLLDSGQGLGGFPLWIATAGVPAGQPGVPGWTLHQYGTGGGIDHDVSSTDLSQYAIPGVDVPMTPDEIDAVATATVNKLLNYTNPSAPGGSASVYAHLRATDAILAAVQALASAPATAGSCSCDPAACGAAVVAALAAHPLAPKP